MDAGGTGVLVVIGSFAVDRIVSLALFGLSFPKSWRRTFPDPDLLEDGPKKRAAVKMRKAWYFLFATILSVPIVIYGGIRIFDLLGIPRAQEAGGRAMQQLLDKLLTTLIFVAGADRLADLLKKHSTPIEKPREGIEVFGTLTIDGEKHEAASVKCPACSAVLEAGSTFCGHCGAHLAATVKAG